MKKLHNLQARLRSSQIITTKELGNVKGGKRFVTTNYAAFASKRNELQNKRANMCITQYGNEYCIEW